MQAVRRVVTGHDAAGRAVVQIDETMGEAVSGRPGVSAWTIWTTEGNPVDNAGAEDAGKRQAGITLPNGTVFRVIDFAPGVMPKVHRTESIDYLVVMSGEIDLELDDGVTAHLRAGDVLVQRGTIHNWINRGAGPCRLAVVLVAAKPVAAGGKVLGAEG